MKRTEEKRCLNPESEAIKSLVQAVSKKRWVSCRSFRNWQSWEAASALGFAVGSLP